MRDLEFEFRVANEPICGVKPIDIKNEIMKAWSESEMIPSFYKSDNIQESDFYNTLADVASYTAQCLLRKINK